MADPAHAHVATGTRAPVSPWSSGTTTTVNAERNDARDASPSPTPSFSPSPSPPPDSWEDAADAAAAAVAGVARLGFSDD